MNDKQQLAAMGAHMAAQPLCMAKRIEELEAQLQDATRQCGAMADALREMLGYVDGPKWQARIDEHKAHEWLGRIEALLAGQVPAPASPDCELTVPMIDGLRRALTTMGIAAPDSLEELGWKQRQYVERLIRACQRRPVPAVPEDWRLVPVKPTPAMRDAMRNGSRKDWPSDELCNVRYAAMLASAPSPDSAK